MAKTILLVEDGENWYEVINFILEENGYKVIRATTPQKAKNLLSVAHNSISVIIVNLNLTKATILDGMGYQLLQEIELLYPQLPRIVLSAIKKPEKIIELYRRYKVTHVQLKDDDEFNGPELIQVLGELTNNNEYDVFLCHNQIDKPAIKRIATELNKVLLKPWLDMWDIRPGTRWQDETFKSIGNVKAVAIFIGPNGIGPWQNREVNTFLYESSKRDLPIIPVILPECEDFPDLPHDLRTFHWVDFRMPDHDPFSQLLWGITGQQNYLSEIMGTISTDSLKLQEDIRDIIFKEANKIKTLIIDHINGITRKILDQLKTSQIAVIHALIIAIKEAQLPPADWGELLNFIRDLRQNPPPDKAIANAIQSLPATVDDPQNDVTSRVKLTLPIIPMLLAYEADYELRENLNLWEILKRIVKKINRTD